MLKLNCGECPPKCITLEFEAFIEAVKKGDQEEIRKWSDKLNRVLTDYLRIRFKAPLQDAEDCTQDAILTMMEVLGSGKDLPQNPGGYLRSTAKYNYFRLAKSKKRFASEVEMETDNDGEDPAAILIKEEMKAILHKCIQKLDELQQKMIRFWMETPGIKADKVALHFEMSVSNVWVRRHRINKSLEECIRKNM